jgi:hypothetical protein
MPQIMLSLPHALPVAKARQRVEQLVEELHRRYCTGRDRVTSSWDGDTFTFQIDRGLQSATGQLAVTDRFLHITIDLPWALVWWKRQVQTVVEQEGRRLLAD